VPYSRTSLGKPELLSNKLFSLNYNSQLALTLGRSKMTDFEDLSSKIPEPDPIEGNLFSEVMKHPQAAQLIKSLISSIAIQTINRGGRLNIIAEGPEQGITVEVDGKIFRLSPCGSNDPEETAMQQQEHRAIAKNKMQDPLAVNMTALRNLLITDSKLKGR
jgi:hypothetical protein